MKTLCGNCRKIIPMGTRCECRKKQSTERNRQNDEKYAELTKMLKSARWRKFKAMIKSRDGQHCQRCLIKYNIIETNNLQVHHILPRSTYPELMFEETNCVTLCKTCNLQLGTQETLDFPFEIKIQDDFVL